MNKKKIDSDFGSRSIKRYSGKFSGSNGRGTAEHRK